MIVGAEELVRRVVDAVGAGAIGVSVRPIAMSGEGDGDLGRDGGGLPSGGRSTTTGNVSDAIGTAAVKNGANTTAEPTTAEPTATEASGTMPGWRTPTSH